MAYSPVERLIKAWSSQRGFEAQLDKLYKDRQVGVLQAAVSSFEDSEEQDDFTVQILEHLSCLKSGGQYCLIRTLGFLRTFLEDLPEAGAVGAAFLKSMISLAPAEQSFQLIPIWVDAHALQALHPFEVRDLLSDLDQTRTSSYLEKIAITKETMAATVLILERGPLSSSSTAEEELDIEDQYLEAFGLLYQEALQENLEWVGAFPVFYGEILTLEMDLGDVKAAALAHDESMRKALLEKAFLDSVAEPVPNRDRLH